MIYIFCLMMAIPSLVVGATPSSPFQPSPQQAHPGVLNPPSPSTTVPPPPVPPPPPTLSPGGAVYTAPGTVTVQEGQWVGSENLYNLTDEIGIVVEIITPKGTALPFSEATIRENVMKIFQEARIPINRTNSGETPLPFFHLLLMINPIDKGFVAYCSGRLFESIDIARVNLPPGIIWQGTTWEKQELILFGTAQLQEQITTVVQKITTAFVQRYREQNR